MPRKRTKYTVVRPMGCYEDIKVIQNYMCWQRCHATFLVKTWVRRQPLPGALHGNGVWKGRRLAQASELHLRCSPHTRMPPFLLVVTYISLYINIHHNFFVVLFRYFLTFKKHILGFQKQWRGQALMDLRLLNPLHIECLYVQEKCMAWDIRRTV